MPWPGEGRGIQIDKGINFIIKYQLFINLVTDNGRCRDIELLSLLDSQ